jgi:hypothetical protein
MAAGTSRGSILTQNQLHVKSPLRAQGQPQAQSQLPAPCQLLVPRELQVLSLVHAQSQLQLSTELVQVESQLRAPR